jgi:hypothetical protein
MFKMETSKIYANSLSDALRDFNDNINSSDASSVGGLMSSVISFAVPLSVFSVFILLVLAAYKLMTSQGNPDKLKEGQEVITNAIIGFLFILLSVAILLLISNLFSINIGGQ